MASSQPLGLADHLEVAGPLERPAQALADQLVVVDEQHRDGHDVPLPRAGVGSLRADAPDSDTSTTVPPPTRLRTDRDAPSRVARSLMMSNP